MTSPSDAIDARFRRNRMLANGLLGGMGVAFVATHLVPDPNWTVQLLQAASEAGLVGGIADWFAVTALFRRPLGMPIPHTAIVPRSKDRIADNLGGFVEEHFLTAEIISGKLKELDAGRRFGEWLAKPANARIIAEAFVKALPYAIRSIGSSELRTLANELVGDQLRNADASPVVARVLRAISSSPEIDALFDKAVDFASSALATNREEVEAAVRGKSQWWIPGMVDKKIATSIVTGMSEVIAKLHEPDSEGRKRFRSALDEFIVSLETSEHRKASVNEIKNRMLDHPEIKAWIGSLWDDASQAAIEDLESTNSRIAGILEDGFAMLGRMLADDEDMQTVVDQALERIGLYLVSWRGEIGKFFTDVVRNWDARTLTQRLEQAVGSDLQYIRMNGTVVGAFVGCALFAATQVLH